MGSSHRFLRVLRKLPRADEGQALIELALLMPLLLLLLLGIVELGRLEHYNILATGAARAGVQYGQRNLITAADNPGMQTAALNGANNFAGLTATATSYCACADGSASACQSTDCSATHRLVYVRVTTALTYKPLFAYPGVPKSMQISRVAIMQVPP